MLIELIRVHTCVCKSLRAYVSDCICFVSRKKKKEREACIFFPFAILSAFFLMCIKDACSGSCLIYLAYTFTHQAKGYRFQNMFLLVFLARSKDSKWPLRKGFWLPLQVGMQSFPAGFDSTLAEVCTKQETNISDILGVEMQNRGLLCSDHGLFTWDGYDTNSWGANW